MTVAFTLGQAGRLDEASSVLDELFVLVAAARFAAGLFVVEFALTCDVLGRRGEFTAALASSPEIPLTRPTRLFVNGDVAAAARLLDEFGVEAWAAYVRLRSDDEVEVTRALEFWRSVGATRYVDQAEALLAATA